MKRKMWVIGGIGAGVLLVLAMFPVIVDAQAMKPNEMKTNILQQIQEKIKNNDWKLSGINIKLLKENIKDVTWFPGSLIYIFFAFIIIISMMFGFPII